MQKLKKFLVPVWGLLFSHATFAQSYKIGTIDVYGTRKTNPDTILAHLSVKEGDSITHESFKSADEAERLKQIEGVKYATVNPVCCDTANNLMLYIGIGETEAVILKYRNTPAQNIKLPVEMINAFHNFNDQIEPAINAGQGGEDYSHGYALINYPPARNEQEKFTGFATKNLSLLAHVLKDSKYAEQRAAAAQIIAYSANKKEIVSYLLYAVDDPDEGVRNNATRALAILAGYLSSHPELEIVIPAAPFIKMVNSIVWTDRNKGAWVLMQLTKNRDPKLLNEIKRQALPSIIEMAKWKDRGHAYFSFAILGHIAGVNEKLLFAENYSNDWADEVKAMADKCCH